MESPFEFIWTHGRRLAPAPTTALTAQVLRWHSSGREVAPLKRPLVLITSVVALAAFGVQVSGAVESRGAREYRNCRALHRDWEHGVARSRAAANAEVNDGYGRPYVSRALYRANRDLDANDDGVACEA